MGFVWLRPLASPLSPRKKRWSTKTGGKMDLGLIKWSLSQKAALMWSVTLYCSGKKNTFLKKWLNENTFKRSLEGPEQSGRTGGRVQGPHLAGTLKEGKWVWVEVKVGSDPITTSRKVELREEKRSVWDRGGSPGKQDVQRNNPKTISLHPSLSILAKHFQGCDGGLSWEQTYLRFH